MCPPPQSYLRPAPMQLLSDLLTQTRAEQSTMAKAAAATASLLQGNLLNTMTSLSQTAFGRLTTQLIEDGYEGQLATVLGDFTGCLRRASANPKTFFRVHRYSTPTTPTDTVNTTAPEPSR